MLLFDFEMFEVLDIVHSLLGNETWRLLHNWNYFIDAKFEARAAHIHGVGRRYFPIYSLQLCAVL